MNPSIPRDWQRRRFGQLTCAAIAGTVLALAVFADIVSGPHVTLLVAYVLVLMFTARYVSAGMAIAFSVAAAGGQLLAARPWEGGLLGTPVPYWNALARIASYLAIVWVVRVRPARLSRAERSLDDVLPDELQIRDAEQRRIGRALHDGLSQPLTASMLASKVLEERLNTHSPAEADRARMIAELLDEAMGQVRDVSRCLHPPELADDGLRRALSRLAATTRRASGIRCRLVHRWAGGKCDAVAATHLYRIAQEAVNNAVRHANPGRIFVALSVRDGSIQLAVSDDGVGCIVPGPGAQGLGLRTMRERARAIGGRLEVLRKPRGGTRVVCTVSLPAAERSTAADSRMNPQAAVTSS